MGLIDTLACPHFDGGTLGVKRREAFEQDCEQALGCGRCYRRQLRHRGGRTGCIE